MIFNVTLIVIISYLVGAIPVAYLIARLNSVNIFEVGSGNMGTTNVIRAVGPRMGVLVLILDMLKGTVTILIARSLLSAHPDMGGVLAAIFTIVGHNWSIFARIVTGKLRGGKGAATALGTAILVLPYYVIITILIVGPAILIRTRLMSLAVLVMVAIAASMTVVAAAIPNTSVNGAHLIYVTVLVTMILYRFRENIERLRAGNERRVGERA